MDSRKMKAVEPNGTRSIMVMAPGMTEPLITQQGSVSFQCASCDQTILRNVNPAALLGIVFRCSCGTHNVIPPEYQVS